MAYTVFRLSHIYYLQTWDTDVIAEDNGKSKAITIHINCTGDTSLLDKVPITRTEIIRAFIKDGRIEQGILPIQTTPIYADYNMLDTLAGLINGALKFPLPVVYVSKITDRAGGEINIEKLALRLAGVAFIIAETKDDFSFHLREKTDSQNPFNGHIGIYYPNGSKARKIKPTDTSAWGSIDNAIMDEMVKVVTSQVGQDAPTWEQFYADKMATDAKNNEALLEAYINGYDSLEDKLKAAKEKIAALTEENTALRNKNNSMQAALAASGIEESIITKSPVKEFFDGEQHDLLVTVLKEAAARCGGTDTRQNELINSLLENNDYIGNGREIIELVRRVLSNGEAIGKREIAELDRVGFALVNESNHYKFVFRSNARYWFTVSKTPSDRRSGMNNASDIIKRLTVYQAEKK